MTYFTKNGADIPEELLQAHEEGSVVFFCGAGISVPSNLPDFGGLVQQLYTQLGTKPLPIEAAAIADYKYDAAIDLLERRIPGGRAEVRKHLPTILKANLRRKHAKTAHRALLTLGHDREQNLKLVTTNFDRIFERITERGASKQKINSYAAPLLPIPKRSRWNGLVYLHGLLNKYPTSPNLNSLILTSGDFGLAYLTERWASRFVTDLFKNYVVCFVGYGINDPVLRYMMDAISVDEGLGEQRQKAYAFGSFQGPTDKNKKYNEWRAKGVSPLLYEVPAGTKDHSSLYLTLEKWAETYRDGSTGKKSIVARHAASHPLSSDRSDYVVGRILWALTDPLAAKYFANLDPVPPLSWLKPLSNPQFAHSDLSRFGVTPDQPETKLNNYSFLKRPTRYQLAPWMNIANFRRYESGWDEVMQWLAYWLSRHLDDPTLALWLISEGGVLSENFSDLLGRTLANADKATEDGNEDELMKLKKASPLAIPRPALRIVYELLLSGKIGGPRGSIDIFRLTRRLKFGGLLELTPLLLREILEPKISLQQPYDGLPTEFERPDQEQKVKDFFRCEITIAINHPWSHLKTDGLWPKLASPRFIDEYTSLLKEAFRLARLCGISEEFSDLSYLQQPSISDHPQNRQFHDWTILIELARDSLVEVSRTDPTKALRTIAEWIESPSPLFKRLAFFGATLDNVAPPMIAAGMLLRDDNWWMWSTETQRETIRLLVHLAQKGNEIAQVRIEKALLKGPPRKMFRDDTDEEDYKRHTDRMRWLRLAKIATSGELVTSEAKQLLTTLSKEYPVWKISDDERDEFPTWMETGGFEREVEKTPESQTELAQWLRENTEGNVWSEDDWRKRCTDSFDICLAALSALAEEEFWPVERWREAIQAWSEDASLAQSWNPLSESILDMPEETFSELSRTISWWLEKQGEKVREKDDNLFEIARKLIFLKYEDEAPSSDPVGDAINHPVGQAIKAVLNWWYRQELTDGCGLAQPVKDIFSLVIDTESSVFRHGRVLLGTHVITIYRVDPDWARASVLPLFSWENAVEAKGVWEGFLWSPRIFRPLFSEIGEPFLESARHYTELGDHGEQYAALFTYVALDRGDIFTDDQLRSACDALTQPALKDIAHTLNRALESTDEQRGSYLQNRIAWFIKVVWPKKSLAISSDISEAFARLCITANENVAMAWDLLKPFIREVNHPDYIVYSLSKTEICQANPRVALELLSSVIGENRDWPSRELSTCLDQIQNADRNLEQDRNFIRLRDFYERRG